MLRMRSKKDVDAHVDKLEGLLTDYERKLKDFEVAKMYMDVGAVDSARVRVDRYLSIKGNSVVAHKFKGKVLEVQGLKDKALNSYKRSFELDGSQSEILINICRLLTEVRPFDLEEARHWYNKAQGVCPHNKAVVKLLDLMGLFESGCKDEEVEEEEGEVSNDDYENEIITPPARVMSLKNHHSSTPARDNKNSSFRNTPKSGRRFVPRPSPERLAAQIQFIEKNQESISETLSEKLDSLGEQNQSIMKSILTLIDEVKQSKTVSQNVATELTLLKKDLHEGRIKEIRDIAASAATAATTAAAIALSNKESAEPSNNNNTEDSEKALLKQQLRDAERHAALQHVALMQMASSSYGLGAMRPTVPTALPTVPQPFASLGSMQSNVAPGYALQSQLPPFQLKPNPNWQHLSTENSTNILSNSAGSSSSELAHVVSSIPASTRQVSANNTTPTNIVISTSDKIPVVGQEPVPAFSGSVTIPPEHRLGVKPLPISATTNVTPSSRLFPMDLPPGGPKVVSSPFKASEEPAFPVASTSILSQFSKPVYSAIADSSEVNGRHRQVSLNSTHDSTIEEEDDPRPDFKPIIPLPDEVEVVTGEEEEEVLFEHRSRLYRFVDKMWKERGVGDLKILKHKTSGKVRVIMRREVTLKVCANHHIVPEIKIERKDKEEAITWAASDFSDEEVKVQTFCARFKTPEIATKFLETFIKVQASVSSASTPVKNTSPLKVEPLGISFKPEPGSWECASCYTRNNKNITECAACHTVKPGNQNPVLAVDNEKSEFFHNKGGIGLLGNSPATTFTSVFGSSTTISTSKKSEDAPKPSPLSAFSFGNLPSNSGGFVFSTPSKSESENNIFGTPKMEPKNSPTKTENANSFFNISKDTGDDKKNESHVDEEEHDPCPDFKPIIPLPDKIDVVTGEEEETTIFNEKSKLFRFAGNEWKEKGVGQMKILINKQTKKVRVLMRREITLKICANHYIVREIVIGKNKNEAKAVTWTAYDYSDEEVKLEKFCAKFKFEEVADNFLKTFKEHQLSENNSSEPEKPVVETLGSLDQFKPKPGSWECQGCFIRNDAECLKCPACDTIQPGKEVVAKEKVPPKLQGYVGKCGFKFSCAPSAATGFVFGSTSTPTFNYKPFGEIKNEIMLSFENQSLKLNTEKDAEEVVKKIKSAKEMHVLCLSGNTVGIEAAKAIGKALEAHPEFRRANFKDMFTGRMKEEIPPALIHLSSGIIAAKAQLVELDLSDNAFGPIGMNGLKDLLKSPTCYSLKELRLNNTGCGTIGGKHLAELLTSCYENSKTAGYPLQLRVFVLGRSRQENEGAIALAKIFKTMGSLEEVSMPQNGIYFEGINALMDALSNNPNLRILNLNDNTFTFKGAQALTKALPQLQSLEVLNIGDCLLKTDGAKIIADAINDEHTKLKELCMESNEITADGGFKIVEAVKNKSNLVQLNIGANKFGKAGCIKILNKLKEYGKEDLLKEIEDDESDDEETVSSSPVKEGTKPVSTSPINEEKKPVTAINVESENIFGVQTRIFGDSNASNIKSIFGGSSVSTIEGSNNPVPSIFGGNSSLFGKNASSSPFGSEKNGAPSSITDFKSSSGNNEANASDGFSLLARFSEEGKSGFVFGKGEEGFTFSKATVPVFGKTSNNDASKGEDGNDEEHDPHFEPIIPLPDLVKINTGEEEEKIIFKNRSKLYRFDPVVKEWKDRGLGDIKILHHEGRNTFRVVLRREHVHTIACNHLISMQTEIKPMNTSDTSLSWFAMDFSDEEKGKYENFAVKFKEIAKKEEFKKIFEDCCKKLQESPMLSKAPINVARFASSEEESEDEYEDRMFIASCHFVIENKGHVEFNGIVDLGIDFDRSLGVARISAHDNDYENYRCDHPILPDTNLVVSGSICTWSAHDDGEDGPVVRTYKATFEVESKAQDFKDSFNEGKDMVEPAEN